MTACRDVLLLPDNPYIQYSQQGEEEEIFFSDDEDHHQSGPGNGGKEQEAKLKKLREILNFGLNNVQSLVRTRREEIEELKEILEVTIRFKSQLEEYLHDHDRNMRKLETAHERIEVMKSAVGGLDVSDSGVINQLHQSALEEIEYLHIGKTNSRDLKLSLKKSSIILKFEKTNNFLDKLEAGKDLMTLSLETDIKDPPSVFLLKHLLTSILYGKISEVDSSMKVHNGIESMSDSSSLSQPVSEPFISKKEERRTSESTSQAKIPAFMEIVRKPPMYRKISNKTVGETNRPHCYFLIGVDQHPLFRVVFQLRPDMAPKMVDNFIKLCRGLKDGRGYRGSRIFSVKANKYVVGGDFENNDGTGSHGAGKERYFIADQTSMKDQKGTIRMKGVDGNGQKCKVGSQFMIWVGDVEDRNYKISLVFGKVVEGLEELTEVSRIARDNWVMKKTVTVVESGTL